RVSGLGSVADTEVASNYEQAQACSTKVAQAFSRRLEFLHSAQALAALVMPWSVILKFNGTNRAGFSTISLRSSVIRSKHEGRRAFRRHLGNSAYSVPRSAPQAWREASSKAL